MNRTHSEIVVPIEKPAHVSGNFNCRQSGIMLDVHQSIRQNMSKAPLRRPGRRQALADCGFTTSATLSQLA